MNVFVTRELPGNVLARIPADWPVTVWPGHGPPPPTELLTPRDGILCLLTDRIDATVLDASGAKVVSQMAVGVDNIDLAACTARGVPVGHTPGVLTETTADLTWALILATARRITEAERFLRAGEWTTWSPSLLCGMDVHGATLGIVGYGEIGKAVARRADGFGMRIVSFGRGDALDFGGCDIVTVHAPLSTSTRGLIGARELATMRPDAILINTARGGVVDEDALADALRHRRIAAAGLDVFATEPLPMDSPLLDLPNVVLVPHIGSATIATRTRMAAMAVDNLVAGLRGERMPNCANPAVYDHGRR